MSGNLAGPADGFFDHVLAILREARGRAYRTVNHIMVEAYWQIGQRIVEEEQGGHAKAAYGDRLMEELSRRLGDELGRGFSVANLKNFRQFYRTFPDREKRYALRRELGWSYYTSYRHKLTFLECLKIQCEQRFQLPFVRCVCLVKAISNGVSESEKLG